MHKISLLISQKSKSLSSNTKSHLKSKFPTLLIFNLKKSFPTGKYLTSFQIGKKYSKIVKKITLQSKESFSTFQIVKKVQI